MADTFKYVQCQPFTLAGAGNAIGATSIVLTSFQDIDGNDLAITDFGSFGFGTIEPGNKDREEQIAFTGVTQNANGTATLSGVKSVLFKTPYTKSVGAVKSHPGGVQFVISNTAGFYDELSSKQNDEDITGVYTFITPAVPRLDASYPYVGSESLFFITKEYADSLSFAGVADASTTTKGIIQLAKTTDALIGVTTGSTGALLVAPNSLVNETPSANYIIPITNDSGKLDQGFLDLSQDFAFTGSLSVAGITDLDGTVNLAGANANFNSGTNTFAAIPILPASNPTTDNQAARKYYVDLKSIQEQLVGITFTSGGAFKTKAITSTTDGTAIFVVLLNSATNDARIVRYARDTTTGKYYFTNTAAFPSGQRIDDQQIPGVAVVGNYVYVSYYENSALTAFTVARFDKTDLANAAAMTVSGTAPSSGDTGKFLMYTDGADLYIYANGANTNWYHYTISGTTITRTATITSINASTVPQYNCWSDGTNVYFIDINWAIAKYTVAGASVSSTTRDISGRLADENTTSNYIGVISANADGSLINLVVPGKVYDDGAVNRTVVILSPFTKP